MAKRTCSIEGCERPSIARGWCGMHYLRWRAHGDQFERSPGPLTSEFTIRVPDGEAPRTLARLMDLETDDCVLWPLARSRPDGYGRIRFEGRTTLVHVLACIRRHGERPAGHEVAHTCGVRICMNYRHLRWATPTENQADKVRHGTTNRGERYGRARLTWDQVRDIRRLRMQGESARSLGKTYGVTSGYIGRIVNHQIWID